MEVERVHLKITSISQLLSDHIPSDEVDVIKKKCKTLNLHYNSISDIDSNLIQINCLTGTLFVA